MGKEIEHRFLVNPDKLPRALGPGRRFWQGYLSFGPTVRVRLAQTGSKSTGYLTIKGPGMRMRSEFEYEIPSKDALELLKLCGPYTLEKTRYQLGNWEVDRYYGRHAGLWLAELELPSEKSKLPVRLPEWLGREVTTDRRFTNSNLVRLTKAGEWKRLLK